VLLAEQRISYVDPATITDRDMLAELDRCRREGTPRPESQAIRAHVPAAFWSFADTWEAVFRNGVMDHAIKELCRVYVSRSVKCEYCGNQRSMKSAKQGLVEADYKDLLDFEKSTRYDERQKAALAYAEAITWDLEADDALWAAEAPFHRAADRRTRLFRCHHHGPAALAQDAQHRAPPDSRGYRRIDGTRLRNRRSAGESQGRADYWAKSAAVAPREKAPSTAR
jgi:alkylhydroperoxidase family enzyme